MHVNLLITSLKTCKYSMKTTFVVMLTHWVDILNQLLLLLFLWSCLAAWITSTEQSCLVDLSLFPLATATKITLDKTKLLKHESQGACRKLYLCIACSWKINLDRALPAEWRWRGLNQRRIGDLCLACSCDLWLEYFLQGVEAHGGKAWEVEVVSAVGRALSAEDKEFLFKGF